MEVATHNLLQKPVHPVRPAPPAGRTCFRARHRRRAPHARQRTASASRRSGADTLVQRVLDERR